MIVDLVFCENGLVMAFDEGGQQVGAEQGPAFVTTCRDKLNRGVVTRETRVRLPGNYLCETVGQVLDKFEGFMRAGAQPFATHPGTGIPLTKVELDAGPPRSTEN